MTLDNTILGKAVEYTSSYSPKLLYPIKRSLSRHEMILNDNANLPLRGVDIWNCYEVSWLNENQKPEVRILEFAVSATSEYLIESKSLKLYLNSFNNTFFAEQSEVEQLISRDLSTATGSNVTIKLKDLGDYTNQKLCQFKGNNIDHLDITIKEFMLRPEILTVEDGAEIVTESVYSNLLKSNCLVTGQPDWASIQINYTGPKIKHENLLHYIVSFRNHSEFHEQCVERIFCDIKKYCRSQILTVYARYTRRGGIDINPLRTDDSNIDITMIENCRHVRQ